MTAGGAESAVTRSALAPVFAPDGVAVAPPPALGLAEKLRAYDPKADTGVIDAAYALAAKAHGTQRRDNGDPYITHPVAVADIVADYRLDVATVITSLMHDVIEDTPVKLSEIETRFGKQVAGLVDGVTKL